MGSKDVIVVGVDGSPDAQRATDWALDEARVHGDTVRLVNAWQFPSVGIARVAGGPLPVFGRQDIEKLVAEVLDKAAETARQQEPGVEVETRLVEGHPGAALVEASSDARLLVVGSRGLGGFKGVLMGSVSSSCAHHAHCPVVVVPSGKP